MFAIYTQTPQFSNDICDEIRLFFPVKKIITLEDEFNFTKTEYFIAHNFKTIDNIYQSKTILYNNGKIVSEICENIAVLKNQSKLESKKYIKRFIKRNIYNCLKSHTKKVLPWGSLTGIRPTKLTRELGDLIGKDEAYLQLKRDYDVTDEKALLSFEIVENQNRVIKSVNENDIDLYINIPFCLSRCKYCSFILHDYKNSYSLKEPYINALKKEINAFIPILKQKNLRSLYIGGGTPTALSDAEFLQLLKICKDIGQFYEFTVEAGRPDTITENKLSMMKDFGVNRISINPQTLNQRTLDIIGRKHTVEQFFNAYKLAEKYGFNSINTDIILGLPHETDNDMDYTIKGILDLEPQNITVHTLALKRSSEFVTQNYEHFCNPQVIEKQIEKIREEFASRNYLPYYLYRQKYMNGNLENTGFCKKGFECIYNIDNMEEIVSIAAFGSGSISKRIFNEKKRIERQANIKDIELYINNLDNMIHRKQMLFC